MTVVIADLIHSDTVWRLARADASIRLMSAALNRITIRPAASPFGSVGQPIFLGFGFGIGSELLNDYGAYRKDGRGDGFSMEDSNVSRW